MRGGAFFSHLFEALQELEENEINHEILFLEAGDDVLLRRFKETRRRHPLSDGGLLEAIQNERLALSELRGKADRIIDTSALATTGSERKIYDLYEPGQRERSMPVLLVSFGFKYGMPLDADLVFDVRFLPNPHYVDHLRPSPGRILGSGLPLAVDGHHKYIQKLQDFLEFSMPYYIHEGKAQLVVALGCTGKHRSVALTAELGRIWPAATGSRSSTGISRRCSRINAPSGNLGH